MELDHASYRIHISLIAESAAIEKPKVTDFFLTSLRHLGASKKATGDSLLATAQHSSDPRLSRLSIASLDMQAQDVAASLNGKGSVDQHIQDRMPEHSTKDAKYKATMPVARFEKESSFSVDEVDVAFGIVHMFRDEEVARNASLSTSTSSLKEPSGSSNTTTVKNRIKTRVALEDDSGTILALLGVPSHLGPAEVLRFVNRAESAISQVRMIREEEAYEDGNRTKGSGKCMVLLKFREAANAEEFHKMYADRPFDLSYSPSTSTSSKSGELEPPHQTLCRVVYVTAVTMSTSASLPYAFPLLANSDPWPLTHSSAGSSSSSTVEMPTCPVCLERMDASVTGLMTVTCQHTFHCSCLGKWTDSRCPVCRYTQSRGGHSTLSHHRHEDEGCSICHTHADLWVCLICATAGCGRYKAGHAHAHYQQTGHLFALDVETERVWDYGRDGYVHRLIQNKNKGSSSSSQKRDSRGPTPREAEKGLAQQPEEGTSRGEVNQEEEEEEDQKMEALGLEFSQLVSSQLESQRSFYEDQLRSMETKLVQLEIHAAQSSDESRARRLREDAAKREAAEAKSRAEQLTRVAEKMAERSKELDVELKAERQMGKGLIERLKKVEQRQAEVNQEEVAALRRDNEELKEQVRDLMFFLDAQSKMEKQSGEEIKGGDVVGVGKSAAEKKKKKNKRRKGKAGASGGTSSQTQGGAQTEQDQEDSEVEGDGEGEDEEEAE